MLAIFMALVIAGGGFAKEPPAEVRTVIAKANAALVDEDRAEAVRLLEPVALRSPEAALLYARAGGRAAQPARADDVAALFLAGCLATDRAERDAHFRRVGELAPKEVWGPLGRAIAALEADAVADAIPLFERAMAIDSREPAVLGGLATALTLVPSRRGEAVTLVERLLEIAPESIHTEAAFDAVLPVVSRYDVARLADIYVRRNPNGRRWVACVTYQTRNQVQHDEVEGAQAVVTAWMRISTMRGERHARDRGAFFREFVLPAAVAAGGPTLDALGDRALTGAEDSPEILLALANAFVVIPDDTRAVRLLERALDVANRRRGAPDELTDDIRFALAGVRERAGDAAGAAALYDAIRPDGLAAKRAALSAGAAWLAARKPELSARAYARAVAIEPNRETRDVLATATKSAGLGDPEASCLVWEALDSAARPSTDFALRTLDGAPVSLSSLRGRVVLVTFWFPSCAPCRAEFPYLEALRARHEAAGFSVLAIDITREDAGARRALAELKVAFPSLTGDEDVVEAVKAAYRVSSVPTSILVDREGRAVYRDERFAGEPGIALLERRIELLLAGRP
jgi:thiol-disulfide isomerase/thioredoxin